MYLSVPEPETLTPRQGGLLSYPAQRGNDLDVFGQSLSIDALRAVALALALIVAAGWIDWLVRAARGDEARLIERRYRNQVVPVRTTELTAGLTIDVEAMSALARIADNAGAPILRTVAGAYHVVDGDRVYRYTVEATEGARPAPAPA